ncbi:Cytidyltransferase-like domain-containing protein [Plasmodiophora brassicae]|uniref:Cytidyltransferase-like domain-containing protein n=2 Tax=Plasmodiophora brassicae TaxID=37360 RepID=A0A3P3XYL2_PLABS|nr:unnamed protein product [Plasmodiophora brassicae]
MGESGRPRTAFVSGCYDILHAGHVQFFTEARALADRLVVSFASAEVLMAHKQRRPSIPDDHKKALILALRVVDEVVVGQGRELGLDFKDDFLRIRPDLLVVTTDDKYGIIKRDLCDQVGASYIVLPKTPPLFTPTSTTEIVRNIRAPSVCPLRVDFAGGWLDVPRFAVPGAFIVNCAISPAVTLNEWPYELKSGLGGSAAWAMLNGANGVESELNLGVGWQDPAIVSEGGLCVWKSGDTPELEIKTDGKLLRGVMSLFWTGQQHHTPGAANDIRDYQAIAKAGRVARDAVWSNSLTLLADAVRLSYDLQLAEDMNRLPGDANCPVKLPVNPLAFKYCGGGHGGYAVYLFQSEDDRDRVCSDVQGFRPIEPSTRGCR